MVKKKSCGEKKELSKKNKYNDEDVVKKKIINALIQNYFCVKLFLELAACPSAALGNITIINL